MCDRNKRYRIISYHIISYGTIQLVLLYKRLLRMLCNHASKECPKGKKAFAKAFAINFQYFSDGLMTLPPRTPD